MATDNCADCWDWSIMVDNVECWWLIMVHDDQCWCSIVKNDWCCWFRMRINNYPTFTQAKIASPYPWTVPCQRQREDGSQPAKQRPAKPVCCLHTHDYWFIWSILNNHQMSWPSSPSSGAEMIKMPTSYAATKRLASSSEHLCIATLDVWTPSDRLADGLFPASFIVWPSLAVELILGLQHWCTHSYDDRQNINMVTGFWPV